MSTKEQLRETVMQELVNGQINGTEAARKMRVSIRQVKRLKAAYGKEGSSGLIHGARGKVGSHKTMATVEQTVIGIIRQTYHDFGPLMVCEKLQAVHGIVLGRETIRQMMIRHGIWKAKSNRMQEYHCWRARRAGYGELQQFDGSYHDWFEGRNLALPEVCLLASMDDATGQITYAEFAMNEGVEAVFRFWWAYVLIHGGIPIELYLDKFSTYKINHPAAVDNHELMTQFQRAAKDLDMRLISAHSPQAKGRIERLFETLQDRLVKELRLADISTIEEANLYLRETFIPWFNQKFAVVPRSSVDMHRRLTDSMRQRLANIFSIQHERTINNDYTIRFKNLWYQLKELQPTTVYKTDTVMMEERLDGTIQICYKGCYLNAFLLPERPKKQTRTPTILTTHKLNWKPPHNHPWRHYVISSPQI